MSERRGFVPDLPVLTRSIETFDEYVEKAMRTLNPELTRKQRERHAINGMIAEVGEVCGLVQKLDQGHTLDPVHMCKELGDCAWFFADLIDLMYLNPSHIAFIAAECMYARTITGIELGYDEMREKCKACTRVTTYEAFTRDCNGIDPDDGYTDEWAAWNSLMLLYSVTSMLVTTFRHARSNENRLLNAAATWLNAFTEVCHMYGLRLHDVLLTNINKLEKRYPDGFETKRSKVRAEGDV